MTHPLALRFRDLVAQLTQGNQSEFGRLTGKSASYISRICKGSSLPSLKYLLQLSHDYEIDFNWLVKGEGSWEAPSSSSRKSEEFVFAPLYEAQASAGFGTIVQNESIQEHLAFKKSWLFSKLRVASEELALVTVSGDSMIPTLNHGDLLLVDMSKKAYGREGI